MKQSDDSQDAIKDRKRQSKRVRADEESSEWETLSTTNLSVLTYGVTG